MLSIFFAFVDGVRVLLFIDLKLGFENDVFPCLSNTFITKRAFYRVSTSMSLLNVTRLEEDGVLQCHGK